MGGRLDSGIARLDNAQTTGMKYPTNVHIKCAAVYSIVLLLTFVLGLGIGKADLKPTSLATPRMPAPPTLFQTPALPSGPMIGDVRSRTQRL